MNLLLDTHTFMWWNSEPEKIPSHILTLLQILIAQSQVENAMIVSRDSIFKSYDCSVIW